MPKRGVILALTIFLGALLLFLVEPLIARIILPWFGGTAATWTTCMLFFQLLLLGGYLYAHLLVTYLSPRHQALVHGVLLLAALAFLPIMPSPGWKPQGGEAPVWRIILLLGATVGLPFFVLAASGPLVQKWFAVAFPGRQPFRLYALSNLGSLLALLSYPLVFEPLLRLRTQALVWSGGFIVFGICGGLCAWGLRRVAPLPAARPPAGGRGVRASGPAVRPAAGDLLLWLALAATGSLMLLATTNQISQDIAIVPLLWVLPLALYLLTFILCFESSRWYRRGLFGALLPLQIIVGLAALQSNMALAVFTQTLTYAGVLFICCMICHGELARARPDPQYLTLYYLMIAAGGALGGLLVGVVAPLVLAQLMEFQIGLMATALLFLIVLQRSGPLAGGRPRWAWAVLSLTFLGLLTVTVLVTDDFHLAARHDAAGRFTGYRLTGPEVRVLERSRNFYGTLLVYGGREGWGVYTALQHGRVLHGWEFIEDKFRRIPLTYYGKGTGVQAVLRHFPRVLAADSQGHLNIGGIGLGVGTIAAYGQLGDRIRFYEINPAVVSAAHNYFAYLQDTPATVDIVLGDARLSLERELQAGGRPQFDVLVVDAFTGDAIPVHLLTRECFALYDRALQPQGVLAFNVTNRYLDLRPVVRTLAQELGMRVFLVTTKKDLQNYITASAWLLATRNTSFAAALAALPRCSEEGAAPADPVAWTDDFASILSVLYPGGMRPDKALENAGARP